MRLLLKVLGGLAGLILLLLITAVIVFQVRGIPSYEVEQIKYTAVIDSQSVEQGEKLVTMLCANCHMDPETRKLTGSRMMEAPKEFGAIYSKNITQDPEYGIGDWTDGELLYLFRTGIARDGQYIPPYMAKMPLMADEDINAIIAFLRSDHPLVAPDPTPDRESEPSLLTKALSNLVWKPMPLPEGPISRPDPSNEVALGRYLALNLECFSCHSADFKTNDFLEPERSKGFFGGGNKTLDHEGRVILTSNLTPHAETGIGNWTKPQFIKALRFGILEEEHALRYPMVPFSGLSDHEAGAIYDYLMTIPPIENEVERTLY